MSTLLQFLGLSEDADEETATLSLSAILTSAVRDEDPEVKLSEVYHQVYTLNGSRYLDPLLALPLLIESPDPNAQNLVDIIGKTCSAKEALISGQESLEKLVRDLQQDDDEATEGDDGHKKRTPIEVLIAIVDLYNNVIPRLKLRNKSGFDTVQPHLAEVQEALRAAEFHMNEKEAKSLLYYAGILVKSVDTWLKDDPKDVKSQREELLLDLLHQTLSSCSHTLRTSVAQRTFEDIYPRFKARRGKEEEDLWAEGEAALNQTFSAYTQLGCTPQVLIQTPSITSLIAFAHFPVKDIQNPTVLASFLPYIIASIQTNSLLDESLAVLLKTLCEGPRPGVTAEVAGPLLSVLPELSSGHSDPKVRHLTFRILSKLLSLSPPALRIQVLSDLTGHSEFPQMRAAAVGLVKEALLEAFSSASESPFTSPLFFRVFGPILFRSDPPELLLSDSTTLEEFDESQEPRRLVECLSLYYILLERDKHNLTSVRDADVVRSVENSLLAPLRSKLSVWESENQDADKHDHEHHHIAPLMPLQIALERVDTAKVNLKL